jgi:hypothetical protein
MAITWRKLVRNAETGRDEWVADGVTHEGLVIGQSYTRCVRVMSDIYSDETFVSVIDPDTLALTEVHLGGAFECNTRSGYAIPDLAPELQARLDAKITADAEAHRITEAVEAERRRLAEIDRVVKEPKMGRKVKVVRGRKVKPGTEGVVFWRRDGRVGLALSDRRDPNTGRNLDVAWVDEVYCEALPDGNSDVEVEARIEASRQDFRATKEKIKAAIAAKSGGPSGDCPF